MFCCPKCGTNETFTPDSFCGECEREYRAEQEAHKRREIKQLRADISRCACPEGDCTNCIYNSARIYELLGNYDMARAIINQ